jgi:hypothetical protein
MLVIAIDEMAHPTCRAYQPEQAILDFTYHAPPVVPVA